MDRSNIDPPKWTVWGKRQLNGWVHFCRWWRKFDLAKSVLFRNLPDWDVCCWCLPVGHGWYYSDDPCHQEVQWVVTAASNHNISPSRQVLNWWKDTFGWLHHHFQQFPWPFTRKKCLAKPWFGWYVYIAGLIFWPQNLCIADFTSVITFCSNSTRGFSWSIVSFYPPNLRSFSGSKWWIPVPFWNNDSVPAMLIQNITV